MQWSRAIALAVVVFTFMIVEALRAARNERAQRARGGIEPPGDVYAAMAVLYPALLLAIIAEGLMRAAPPVWLFAIGAVVFVLGKALKWWAILTLGPFWTFRVVVVPGTAAVAHGPYRFLAHPNYAGVVGEFVGVACLAPAYVGGPIATLVFGWLMWRRVRVERRALDAILRP